MGKQRRGFTPEYKDEAVKLVINTGRPVAVVARELGIQESTLVRGHEKVPIGGQFKSPRVAG